MAANRSEAVREAQMTRRLEDIEAELIAFLDARHEEIDRQCRADSRRYRNMVFWCVTPVVLCWGTGGWLMSGVSPWIVTPIVVYLLAAYLYSNYKMFSYVLTPGEWIW